MDKPATELGDARKSLRHYPLSGMARFLQAAADFHEKRKLQIDTVLDVEFLRSYFVNRSAPPALRTDPLGHILLLRNEGGLGEKLEDILADDEMHMEFGRKASVQFPVSVRNLRLKIDGGIYECDFQQVWIRDNPDAKVWIIWPSRFISREPDLYTPGV